MTDTSPYLVPILTIAGSLIASLIGSWLVFRAQMSRIPYQNAHDDVGTAKIALEISETATKQNLELQKEIESLKRILKKKHYRVEVVFSLGETPKVEKASIEAIVPTQGISS